MSLALKVDENQVIQPVRLVTIVKVMNSVLPLITVKVDRIAVLKILDLSTELITS